MNAVSLSNDCRKESAKVVETALQNLHNLATFPQSAIEIMQLADNAQAVANDFEKVIANEPSLSTRILKVVNSSFYGLARQVESIEQAVVLLGFKTVRNIAIAGSCQKLFLREIKEVKFKPSELWTHSIAVASGAVLIAKKNKLVRPDEAYLAGIIHDIGIIIEMQLMQANFAELLDAISEHDCTITFREAERKLLGATHEEFGAQVFRNWCFPDILVQVAGTHHTPMHSDDACRNMTSIINAADILAAQAGIGYTHTVDSKNVNLDVLKQLSMSQADMDDITARLPEAVEEAQSLMS